MTTQGPYHDADATLAVPGLQQKQLLHIISCESLSFRQIISRRLYVSLKGTCSLAGRTLLNAGE